MLKSEHTTRFGVELKNILDTMKITQAQLEKDSGLYRGTISKYIAGKATPSKKTVGRIENSLGLEPGALFCFVEAVRQDRKTCYAPSKKEIVILKAWNRGEKTPDQVAEITGYSMQEIGKYLPLGVEKELAVSKKT